MTLGRGDDASPQSSAVRWSCWLDPCPTTMDLPRPKRRGFFNDQCDAARQGPTRCYRGSARDRPWVRDQDACWPRSRRARHSNSWRASEGWRQDGRGRPYHNHGRWPQGDRRLTGRLAIARSPARRSIAASARRMRAIWLLASVRANG